MEVLCEEMAELISYHLPGKSVIFSASRNLFLPFHCLTSDKLIQVTELAKKKTKQKEWNIFLLA